MRLTIDHRTLYRFSEPQARLVQLLRVRPEDTHDQTVANWTIHVDHDARMRDRRDGYGNHVTTLYVDGPVEAVEIAITGEVLTSESHGVLHGAAEPFPPMLFLRSTSATRASEPLAAFATQSGEGARDPLDHLHRLNAALSERFVVDEGRPEPRLRAGEAFEREAATARDLAQMFVAAARSLGIPARYVSGYRLGAPNEHRPTPHGWAEAFVPDMGWIGFDPCTGLSPGEAYVRVACGLDAAEAAPIAGQRMGAGDEALDVDIQVTFGGDA